MSRIAGTFAKLRAAKRAALIPFVTAGDPNNDVTVPLMHALVEAGADIVELGVPFSDPMADGPVIQRASERALHGGTTLKRVLDMVREFRQRNADTPVVLMGYLNPFEIAGYDAFARAAADAGVDGVLTVDLPPEEAAEFLAAVRANDIDLIFLLAPTSDEARIQRICDTASGFVYYVSLKGVTGASNLDVASVAEKVANIKRFTQLPVGVGFGISDGRTAAEIAAVSDAVVVGSVLVKTIESALDRPQEIPRLLAGVLAEMRQAMDARAETAAAG
ncbi:MAG: tryptophan synthase subunit alpha [Gammaproteobacteria bacterium]|nr:tryptophan synthase subunit alpha [Gammaproteobacteria bacterium]MDH3412834.1 tryptophan synthase subunit alpha [Gammaproteobacteria bacterium]